MQLNILKIFSINLRMGNIEAGPPLSTILGNIGINTVKFCKELNEYIKNLPNYFILEVKIIIFLDKSYCFQINEPSTALLLRLISKKIEIKIKSSGGLKFKIVKGVTLNDIYFISYFKFGNNYNHSLKSVFGTLNSLNLYIIE